MDDEQWKIASTCILFKVNVKNDQVEQIIFTDINLNPIIIHLNLNSLEIMIRTN